MIKLNKSEIRMQFNYKFFRIFEKKNPKLNTPGDPVQE